MRNVWVKTDVATEVVSAAEAKLFCKVTGTGDDTVFAYLIKQARENLEMYCGVSIAEKTLTAEYTKLPKNGIIALPYGPVKSVTSVTLDYEDPDTADEILTVDEDYYVSKQPWTEIRILTSAISGYCTLKVEYIVGYGATGCPPLPYPLKVAMMKEILTEYYIRENINNDLVLALRKESRAMAYPYKRNLWFGPEA